MIGTHPQRCAVTSEPHSLLLRGRSGCNSESSSAQAGERLAAATARLSEAAAATRDAPTLPGANRGINPHSSDTSDVRGVGGCERATATRAMAGAAELTGEPRGLETAAVLHKQAALPARLLLAAIAAVMAACRGFQLGGTATPFSLMKSPSTSSRYHTSRGTFSVSVSSAASSTGSRASGLHSAELH